jgi:hypothetical protein
MMNSSIGKNNISCSANFMGTKSTKKSAKSKTSHSERNLSTIACCSNKENHLPMRNSVKQQNKKIANKGGIFAKDMEMFVSTKKHLEQFFTIDKKKR